MSWIFVSKLTKSVAYQQDLRLRGFYYGETHFMSLLVIVDESIRKVAPETFLDHCS